jgi:hypothetical protein
MPFRTCDRGPLKLRFLHNQSSQRFLKLHAKMISLTVVQAAAHASGLSDTIPTCVNCCSLPFWPLPPLAKRGSSAASPTPMMWAILPLKGQPSLTRPQGNTRLQARAPISGLTKADQFHYVWREMSGDFSVTATAKFLTEGIAHRKAVIMLRKTLGVIPRCLLRKSHVGHVN